jgi:hypothetical protein
MGMKLSIMVAVAALLLTPVLLNASDCWSFKIQGYPGYGSNYDAKAGSALCYGVDYQASSVPCVWLLHGGCSYDLNHFQRFCTASGGRS